MAWTLPGDFAWAFGNTSGGGGSGIVTNINAILPLTWDAGTEVLASNPASAGQAGHVSLGAQTLGTGRKTVGALTSNGSIELVGGGTSTLSQIAGSLNIVSSGSAIETSSRIHTTNVSADAVAVDGGVTAASLRLGAVGQPVVTMVDNDDTMTADSSTRVPTQAAVVGYVAAAPSHLVSPVNIGGNVYTDATLQSLSDTQWDFNKRFRADSFITNTSIGEFLENGTHAELTSSANLILSPAGIVSSARPIRNTYVGASAISTLGSLDAAGAIESTGSFIRAQFGLQAGPASAQICAAFDTNTSLGSPARDDHVATQLAVKTYVLNRFADPVTFTGALGSLVLSQAAADLWDLSQRMRATAWVTDNAYATLDELATDGRLQAANDLYLSPAANIRTARPIISSNATGSTGASSGALQVAGGIGCGELVYATNFLQTGSLVETQTIHLEEGGGGGSLPSTSASENQYLGSWCMVFSGSADASATANWKPPRTIRANTAVTFYIVVTTSAVDAGATTWQLWADQAIPTGAVANVAQVGSNVSQVISQNVYNKVTFPTLTVASTETFVRLNIVRRGSTDASTNSSVVFGLFAEYIPDRFAR